MAWSAATGNPSAGTSNAGVIITIVACTSIFVVIVGFLLFIYIRRKRMFVSLKNGSLVPSVDSYSAIPGENSGQLRCIVKYDYTPNLSDEVELRVGDIIIFESLADDGWGDARNLTSGQIGKACTRFMEPVKQ